MLTWVSDATTWSPTINELVEKGTVGLGPYDLELDYDYWSYCMDFHGLEFFWGGCTDTHRRYHLFSLTRRRT